MDVRDADIGGYVADARQVIEEQLDLPAGYSLAWSGQYEYLERAQQRLALVVPLTLFLIFVIIYINNRSLAETVFVLAGVPFALTGSVWLLSALDYNLSVAVWVGAIALSGLYAETAIVLLLYLDVAYKDRLSRGLLNTRGDLREAIHDGSVKRVRPILMTIATDLIGLIPIMWSAGAGADVMKRIAAPLIGGVTTSGIVVLVIYPIAYFLWRGRGLPNGAVTSNSETLTEA